MNINERLTYVIKQFVKFIEGQTQLQLGVCQIQVLKDDFDHLIVVDAGQIRFYDESGFLEPAGEVTHEKKKQVLKKRKKKCRGIFCTAEARSA